VEHKTNKLLVVVALAANFAIAGFKLAAALLTGSSAMYAEAAHTLADTGNEISLFLGLRLASRPPDTEHPFGYGKERYFWPLMASISMFVIGGTFSVFRAIEGMISPNELEHLYVNYIVLGISAIFDGTSFVLAFKSLRGELKTFSLWQAIKLTKDPTPFNVLFEDGAALVGLCLAFLGVFLYQLTGMLIFDSMASLFIGLLLGGVAIILAYETRSLLLGEAASAETRQKIINVVNRVPGVVQVVDLLTMHMGPDDILVNMDLKLENGLTTDRVEATIDKVEDEIRKAVPQARRIFVECETLRRGSRMLGSAGRSS
jgi:cation diffusion facilitator family transporter